MCPRCRRAERNRFNRTGMCIPCSDESMMQYLRIKALDTEAELADTRERIPGEPRTGYGSTWRYMKIRRTPNLIHGLNAEYKAVATGSVSWSAYVKPLQKGFLRKK